MVSKKNYKKSKKTVSSINTHTWKLAGVILFVAIVVGFLVWYPTLGKKAVAGQASETGEATGIKFENADICGNKTGQVMYAGDLFLCEPDNLIVGTCNVEGKIVVYHNGFLTQDVVCDLSDSAGKKFWIQCGGWYTTFMGKSDLGTVSYTDSYFCTYSNHWIVCNNEHEGTNPNYLATGNYVGKAFGGSFPYMCVNNQWLLLSNNDGKGKYAGQDAILCDNTKKDYIADVVTDTGNFDALCLGDKWAYCNVDEVNSDKIYYDMKNKVVDKGTVMFDNHMLCEKF